MASRLLFRPCTLVDVQPYTFSNITAYNILSLLLIPYILSINGNGCDGYLLDSTWSVKYVTFNPSWEVCTNQSHRCLLLIRSNASTSSTFRRANFSSWGNSLAACFLTPTPLAMLAPLRSAQHTLPSPPTAVHKSFCSGPGSLRLPGPLQKEGQAACGLKSANCSVIFFCEPPKVVRSPKELPDG